MSILEDQIEMFSEGVDATPPTNHDVMEKLAIAKDETRTLLNNIEAVCMMYDENQLYGFNQFLYSRLDPESAIILRDSLMLIYRCLDTATRGLK